MVSRDVVSGGEVAHRAGDGASEGIDAPGVGLASARGIIDDETRRLIPRVARVKAPRGARTASDGPAGMAKISAVSRISAATTDAGVDAQIETTRQRVRVDDARPNLPAPDSRGRFARLRNARARGVGRCALRVANPRNVRSFRDIAKVDFIHPRRPGSRCAFHRFIFTGFLWSQNRV